MHSAKFVVGVTGLEPMASWPPVKRATKLRHTPIYIISTPQRIALSSGFLFSIGIVTHIFDFDKQIEKYIEKTKNLFCKTAYKSRAETPTRREKAFYIWLEGGKSFFYADRIAILQTCPKFRAFAIKKYRNRMPKCLPNPFYLCTICSIGLDKRGKSRSLLFNENVIRSINHHGQNCIASKTWRTKMER